MGQFNRTTLKNQDINCALDEMNLQEMSLGLKEPYHNSFSPQNGDWELSNETLVIKEQTINIEFENFKEVHPLRISFDWVSVHGKIPDNPNTCNLRNKHRKAFVQNLEKKKEIKFKSVSDNQGGQILVKQLQSNILSRETEKFFNSYLRILEEQIRLIDSGQNKMGFNKFLNVLEVMMKNPSMQVLVPIIIHNIERNYREVVVNGALKKNLYIMILDALYKNPKVNLEFYVNFDLNRNMSLLQFWIIF